MSSFKNGVLPQPFGDYGGVCEGLVVEEDNGEDGGVKGGFSQFPLPFGGLSPSPSSHFEELSPFGILELSPCIIVILSS